MSKIKIVKQNMQRFNCIYHVCYRCKITPSHNGLMGEFTEQLVQFQYFGQMRSYLSFWVLTLSLYVIWANKLKGWAKVIEQWLNDSISQISEIFEFGNNGESCSGFFWMLIFNVTPEKNLMVWLTWSNDSIIKLSQFKSFVDKFQVCDYFFILMPCLKAT